MNDVKIMKAIRYLDYHDYSGLSSITTKCLVLEKNDFQLSSMFFTDLPVDMLCFKETIYTVHGLICFYSVDIHSYVSIVFLYTTYIREL